MEAKGPVGGGGFFCLFRGWIFGPGGGGGNVRGERTRPQLGFASDVRWPGESGFFKPTASGRGRGLTGGQEWKCFGGPNRLRGTTGEGKVFPARALWTC